jgi:hypothetical protein
VGSFVTPSSGERNRSAPAVRLKGHSAKLPSGLLLSLRLVPACLVHGAGGGLSRPGDKEPRRCLKRLSRSTRAGAEGHVAYRPRAISAICYLLKKWATAISDSPA